jgi:hypothetical protein
LVKGLELAVPLGASSRAGSVVDGGVGELSSADGLQPDDLVRTGRAEELMRAIRAKRADSFA